MSCLICGEPELEGQEAVCRGCVSQYGRKAQARKRDRAPRNEHDTRVATEITCTECGADDRLPFVPRRKERSCVKLRCEHLGHPPAGRRGAASPRAGPLRAVGR